MLSKKERKKEAALFDVVNTDTIQEFSKDKPRKARDEKDYSAMLMDLVRDEVKKL